MRTLQKIVAALALASLSAVAAAQAPPVMPVQGFLTDSSGAPVDGAVPVTFRLYTNATGGTPVHTESVTIPIVEGRFTSYLGETTPLSLALFDDGGTFYLGVSVAGGSELVPRFELGTAPFAAFAQYAASVPWSGVTGVPAALADGDQDTTYTAALPLVLSGSSFTLSNSGCAVGEAWMWTTGGWDCRSVDTAGLQARVGSTCDPGSAIRQINSDGSVLCEDDDIGGGVQNIAAGAGLSGGGTGSTVNLAVDFGAAQARIDDTCAAGLFMRGVGADGTPACAAPPTPSSIGPGFGLVLSTPTTLAIDQGVVQRVLTANCPAGEYMYGLSAAGAPACRPDEDDNTTYSEGTGIDISGTVIAADAAYLQRRVTGALPCAYGIANIGADGTVACAGNNDTNTTYGAGFGLDLTAGNFVADTTELQRRVQSGAGNALPCTYGIANIAQDGTVTCAANNDTNTTYGAGFGLDLTAGNFVADTTELQQRVNGSLPCVYGIANIAQNGTVTCATNNNSWPPGTAYDCPNSNYYMYGRDDNGYPLCRATGDFVNSECMMWVGWSDSNRACCEALGHSTVYGGHQGGYNGNGGEVRRHWWDPGYWGYTVLLQGMNYGGDVGNDDTLYIALRCWTS